nr:peptide-binding protein [Perspicuibacillus lycopersici]
MKKRKSWLSLLAIVFLLGMLAACSDGNKETTNDPDDGNNDPVTSEPKSGGTVVGAMDTAPTGQFNPIFYQEAYEANILGLTHDSLLSQNDELEFEPHLAKEWKFSEDFSSVTFTLRDDVKWHDGQPFTANDVVFTYKTIADPEYVAAGGVRSSYVSKLVGAEEYTSGETDEFPGVVADDDYTVTFHFKEPNVMALADASFTIIPEHIFKDIPVADMPSAAASLQPNEVIGTGPFKFTEMVEGERYVLTKNPDYFLGEPYLDSVEWRVVNQDLILQLLESGEIDFVADPNGFQAADYDTVANMEHVKIIEQNDFGYQLLGFIQNYRTPEDIEAGVLEPENWVPNERLKDPKVRQAIAYAINRQALIGTKAGEGLLHGRGQIINAPIATQFPAYDGENPNQYEFSQEQANALLDEAGYKDVTGDGLREDPEGNEWVLKLAYPLGNKLREDSAPIIVEMLAEVGVSVDLQQPLEMAAYVPELTNTQDWDLYLLGWTLGSGDPDPSGLWGSKDAYNFGRWYNPEADQLLVDAVTPPDAFDPEFRNQVYSDWQVMFQEDLPALILYAQNKLYAYNERMQGVVPAVTGFINDPQLWWVQD